MPVSVVIAGGGFGGFAAARRLERARPAGDLDVTLISETGTLTYTPFLPQAAAGTLEPRHVVVPLRSALPRTRLHVARIVGIDTDVRTVHCRAETGEEWQIDYDHLIVALGSVPRAAPVPGVADEAVGFKTLADAIWLRNHVLRQLEIAATTASSAERRRRLTFVFVGGGYAGVEALAELEDLVATAMRRYPTLVDERPHWILVEATGGIFPEVGARLGGYALRELVARGIDVRLETTVLGVADGVAALSDGTRISSRTLVWTAGVQPAPVVADLGLPRTRRGRIAVDATMAVVGHPGVWAIGDAADVPDPARPGLTCPPTSQHAVRQGRCVADNIRLAVSAHAPLPFRYRTIGMFVDLGRGKAVASILGLQFKGLPAWFAGRTYHLSQIPGIRRKARVATDWAVGLAFGRDVSELGTLGHPEPLPPAAPRPPGQT